MITYILRRILSSIPVLFGILFVTFAIARLIPGDPCRAILGEKATDAVCEEFLHRHGLDRPIHIQFLTYVGEVAQGDFGESLRFNKPVTDLIIERLPTTLELTLAAMTFSIVLGIPMGIISAVRHNSLVDVITMLFANIGVSMPVFWLGLMLAYFFALVLRDTPFFIPPSGRLSASVVLQSLTSLWGLEDLTGIRKFFIYFISNSAIINSVVTGNWTQLKDALWHLILPSVAVGTIPLAIIARMTRSSLLEVVGLDYIRAARAKGMKEWIQMPAAERGKAKSAGAVKMVEPGADPVPTYRSRSAAVASRMTSELPVPSV